MTRRIAIAAILACTATFARADSPSARPRAAALLTENMLRTAASNPRVAFRRTSMALADSSYDDVHLQAIGLPESFDVALRIWVIGDAAVARDRFGRLHRDLPNVVDTGLIGARAFIAEDADIYGVVFHDDRGVVAMLTCGKQQCQTTAAALDLARCIAAGLPQRW